MKGCIQVNCLLIMPSSRNNDGDYGIFYDFPLGIAYISGAMKRIEGIRTITLNMNQIREEQTRENRCSAVARIIEEESIDVVLTDGLFVMYPRIREIIETAKSVRNNIVTVVGGGIVSADPEASMKALEYVDYGVVGEGETTIVELILALLERRPVDAIQGLVYKEQDELVITQPRPATKALRQLPWCDYKGFGVDKYLNQKAKADFESNHPWFAKPTLPITTSRSCRQLCTFCFHPEGSGYRRRDLDDLFAELDHLVAAYHPTGITLTDAMVCMPQSLLEEFCCGMKKYNIPYI